MALNDRLRAVVDWLHAGYPAGIPPKDYTPVLALLARRLTPEEVHAVSAELVRIGEAPSRTDIGAGITRVTDAPPTENDIDRVEQHLDRCSGWPSNARS